MSRTRRAFLGLLTNYASAIVLAVAGFVLIPIALRYLSREDYGLWATVGQVLGYLALLDLGVGAAVKRRAAQLRERQDNNELSRVISTAIALYCGLGLLFLIAGLSLSALLPRWSAIPRDRTDVAVAVFLIMIAYTSLSFPLRVASSALVGYQRIATANLIDLTANLLSPITAIVLLVLGFGLLALPIGAAFAGLLAATLAIIALKRAVPELRIRPSSISRNEATDLFGWSFLLFLNNLAVIVIYQTDNLVVAAGVGLTAVTVYTLTSRLPLYGMPLVFAIGESCLPGAIELYSQGKVERLKQVYIRILRITAAASLALVVIAAAFNQPFMMLWVGTINFGGMILTGLFAAILFYRVMMQVASVVVISSGKLKGVVYMSLLEAAFNLGLSIWWVREYGLQGVAAATIVAGLLTSGWYVVRFVSTELRLSVADYFLRGIAPSFISALVAAAVAGLLVRFYYPQSWLLLFAEALIVSTVFAVAYLFIGVDPAERSDLYKRLAGWYSAAGARGRAVAS